MRTFIMILFVVALVVVAYETFKPQAPFPDNTVTGYVVATHTPAYQ